MAIHRTLTDTELQALGRVVDHFGPDEFRHYKDDGNPHGHIAESLLALNHYTQKYRLEKDDEAKGQAELENRAPMPGDWAKDLAAARDDAADGMRMQILYSVFNHASLPDSLKTFIDNAIKDNDKKLLMTAQVALDNYLGDMDKPF